MISMWGFVIPLLFYSNKKAKILLSNWNGLLGLLIGTLIFHFLAIMFGAPLIENWQKTALWSAWMSCLMLFPASCLVGPSFTAWNNLFSFHKTQNVVETLCCFSGLGCMVGGWVGAFPIPLDWDRPWQVWPISCTYGSLAGYLFGLILSFGINLTKTKKEKKTL